LAECFESIAANRFETENGRISGMTLQISNPEDKVRYLVARRLDPGTCVAVGDGYTDIPLLDWAGISVLVDRTGKKQLKYSDKKYRVVGSLTDILHII
jgi:phosphoserine phosphatase